VFESKSEFQEFFRNPNHQRLILPNSPNDGTVPELKGWRDSKVERWDWVLADDGGVAQVLYINKRNYGAYVVTPVGTFVALSDYAITKIDDKERLKRLPFFMDTDFRKHPKYNRMTAHDLKFGKNKKYGITFREFQFIHLLLDGKDELDAILMVWPEILNVKAKYYSLMKKVNVREAMAEELKKRAKKAGIDEDWVIEKMRNLIDSAEDDSVKLKALIKLGEQIGIFKTNKQLEVEAARSALPPGASGGFQGFGKPPELNDGLRIDPKQLLSKDEEVESDSQ